MHDREAALHAAVCTLTRGHMQLHVVSGELLEGGGQHDGSACGYRRLR